MSIRTQVHHRIVIATQILSISNDGRKMIASLYYSRKHLTPSAMCNLYKIQIEPKWSLSTISIEVAQSSFSILLIDFKITYATLYDLSSTLPPMPQIICQILLLLLSSLPWQAFRQYPFFSATSSDLYGLYLPYHIHRIESP